MRRLPTAVKVLRGTLRGDRLNRREPQPPRGAPPIGASLPPAVHGWRRRLVTLLAPMRVLTHADGPALELLAFALAEYDFNARVLLEHGFAYECVTAAGATMRRARPEQAIASDAWKRSAVMLASFGLTPASRSKVEGLPPAAGASRWAGLLCKREVAAFQRRRPGRQTKGPEARRA